MGNNEAKAVAEVTEQALVGTGLKEIAIGFMIGIGVTVGVKLVSIGVQKVVEASKARLEQNAAAVNAQIDTSKK